MKVKKVGNIGNGKSQSRTVYSIDGICPTLVHGMDKGNTIPYIVISTNGLAPAITTLQGGTQQIKILVRLEDGSKNNRSNG